MYRTARLRLTFLYSIIFLILFWGLSFGIYSWMNRYFGDRGSRDYEHVHYEKTILQNNDIRSELPSDIVMDELRSVLLVLDIGLLFIIPSLTWFLTGKTLDPIQIAHDRERQFLADVSHDMRTPLSILSGEIELTLRKDHTKKEYKKSLQSNKEEVDGLVALVENMLFLSRENQKHQNMQIEQVDLTDLLAERVSTFQQSAKLKKLKLSFIPYKQSVVIKGNLQLLKRLFTSLLDNAVKYTRSGGKIVVKLSKETDFAIIRITDTGIGIPKTQQERVFDRFFRADTSRTEKGYGLGLSLAKQIIEQHNGKINLDSEENKGTTITLTFSTFTQSRGKNLS